MPAMTGIFGTQTGKDAFVKTSPAVNCPAAANLFFTGGVYKAGEIFEVKYPKTFFTKLLSTGMVPDAYTNITLIPSGQIMLDRSIGLYGNSGPAAISHLGLFRGNMFPIEKEIFSMLETLSKKHSDLNLQELLKLKYPQAEKTLITQQANILNKIHFIIRKLPQKEYQPARKLLIDSLDRIFEPEPLPEDRFSRKNFIRALSKIEISDAKVKSRIMALAENLPQSANSINAFIVKYSQPYKLRYNYETGDYTRITRDSSEIVERLLEPSAGTLDHIHPQAAYRAESSARANGDESAKDLSTFRMCVLTSKKINEEKSDTPLDEFIKTSKYNIPQNIQKHFDALIQIDNKWVKDGRLSDAAQLADYIIDLKTEFELRSKIVKPSLNGFEEKVPGIHEKWQVSVAKKEEKKTRVKKTGHADNSHKEQYLDNSGRPMENRKRHKFSSRYHK